MRWPRRRVLALSLARLIEGTAAGAVCVLLPASVAAAPASAVFASYGEPTRIGILMAAFGVALACGQPLVSWLAGRGLPPRWLAIAGFMLFAVSNLCFARAAVFEVLVGLRVAQGLGMALAVPTLLSLLVSHEPSRRRGATLGFYSSVKLAGLTLGPLLGGALLMYSSPAVAYGITTALVLVACLPVLAVGEPPSLAPAEPGLSTRRESQAAATPGLLLTIALGAFVASACATSLAVLQNEYTGTLGFSPGTFALALSAMLAMRMMVGWPLGWLADRVSRPPLLCCGLLLLSVATVALGLARDPFALVALRAVMGIGMVLFTVPALALVGGSRDAGGDTRRFARVTMGFALGAGVGPLITGFCAVSFGLMAPFVMWGALGAGVATGGALVSLRWRVPTALAGARAGTLGVAPTVASTVASTVAVAHTS